jgi:hypothetical protein
MKLQAWINFRAYKFDLQLTSDKPIVVDLRYRMKNNDLFSLHAKKGHFYRSNRWRSGCLELTCQITGILGPPLVAGRQFIILDGVFFFTVSLTFLPARSQKRL